MECVKELSPMRKPGLKARSISLRQMIGPALSLDNGVSRDTDSPTVEKMGSEDVVEEKPKFRRDTVHSMPKQPIVVLRTTKCDSRGKGQRRFLKIQMFPRFR